MSKKSTSVENTSNIDSTGFSYNTNINNQDFNHQLTVM